ncbi:MAG TPA: hypothetical protein VFU93_09310 [Acidimicrobiales bacterium]|nr:hypothetical protein [Acidimicrobiales bacterium]
MRFLPLVLIAVLLTGCGDDDDEPRAAGATTTTTTDDCAGADPVPVTAVGGEPAEIAATAGDVTLAVVDHGASVDVVGVFTTVDCAYEPVSMGTDPATFAVGGSVTHGDGLRCEGGRITHLSATSDDGETYQAVAVTYEVEGTDLVEVDRSASTIEAQTDPGTLDPYYRLDC